MTVAAKLDKSRKALLLLTGANPAINIRQYTAKGLSLGSPDLPLLLYHLVNEKTIKVKGKLPGIQEAEPAAAENKTTAQLYYEDADPENLSKRARKTLDETILFQEEQGVHILFLAFGYLGWKEDDKADKTWRSPLVLIPVTLINDGLRKEQWSLRYNEEEIAPNHSLLEALRQHFGIELPAMPEWENYEQPESLTAAWQEWITQLKTVITGYPEWEINEDNLLLSFFSFAKFQMYKDLSPEKWCTAAYPEGPLLLRKLLQDGEGLQDEKTPLPESFSFDRNLPAEEPFTVLDLDSSQATVLLEARQSGSMVVQGPPGTGKSTTITNIIADAVNDGKKILFVAEKMAALEVVKDNLNKVNLGKYCLELHGNKTSKTAFLEELKQILDSRTEAALALPFSKEKLNDARDQLRQWSDLINIPDAASGYTPYELFGLIRQSQEKLGEHNNPSLHQLTNNTVEFRQYIAGVTRPLVGYQAAGTAAFHSGKESEQVIELQAYLGAVMRSAGVSGALPETHPFYGAELQRRPSDSELGAIKDAALSCLAPIAQLQQLGAQLQPQFSWLDGHSLNDINKMIQVLSIALQAPDERALALAAQDWINIEATARGLIASLQEAQVLRKKYKDLLIEQAWQADVLQARTVLATTGNNWFNRLFNGKFRTARKSIQGYFMAPQQAKEADLLAIADHILAYQEFKKRIEEQSRAQQYFGSAWQGLVADTALLTRILDWGTSLQQKVHSGIWPAAVPDFISRLNTPESTRKQYEELTAANTLFGQQFGQLRTLLQLNTSVADGWKAITFDQLTKHINNIALHISELSVWVPFYNKLLEFRQTKKSWVADIACRWEQAPAQLLNYFLFKVWEELLQNTNAANPLLDRMTRERLDTLRQHFKQQDLLLKQHYQLQLIQKHNTAVAGFGNIGQAGFVRTHLHRKRNIPSVRRFLHEAFDAITSVKPVFMMSPLSVASYLEAIPELFDMVIFDEASQIEPVDAFGAIFRGKQVIVVGDTKQMPPTSFFKKMTIEDTDDTEEDNLTADMQSIMELMLARGSWSRSLLWHYRSRHQSLIAVSNKSFYADKLLVYPSKEKETTAIGLKLCLLPYQECYYEGQGVNTGEAKRVAQEVLRFATERPHKTLGVVAFNLRQRDLIEQEIAVLARANPALRDFISKTDKEGKRINFIKNLENVQGDERDVIFISIGYGKTDKGAASYNFGPLNKDGGERRLNVLITRAREQNIVFSNFTGDDLDLSRTQSEGVRILARFLNYAATGKMDQHEVSGLDAGSVFEEQVIEAITAMGYQATPQVGSKGYRIDIAVTHPQYPGRFVLAIECDGAAYHNTASARDRDRLRQQILERGGWHFYRIWGANWFRSRPKEIQQLKEAIEAAIRESDAQHDEPAAAAIPVLNTNEEIILKEEQLNQEQFLFPEYTLTSSFGWARSKSIYDLKGAILERYLLKIIHTESPVHLEQIYERIFSFQDNTATQKARHHILQHITHMTETGKAVRKGDFIWTTGNQNVSPRNYTAIADKRISMIAAEELDEAFRSILKTSNGATQEELIPETARRLGFRRTEAVIADLAAHLQTMIQRGLLKEQHGVLVSV